MNLKDFISSTICEIIDGVADAQGKSPAELINPDALYQADHAPRTHFAVRGGGVVHMVEFDVAVTVESSSEGKVGAGIKVFAVGDAGGSASTADKSSQVSRIKFSVPIAFPRKRN
ncbi:MAG TPA: hypothetical protein VGD97_06830 [Lacunisphaera sp.]